MSDFSLELEGIDDAIEELERVEDTVETRAQFTVGTAVFYSRFIEAGTSKMDARPFFQPALTEVRAEGVDGFIRANTRTSVDDLDDFEQVLQVLALALERRIKEIITAKGIIDTGTLRASITAVRGDDPSKLPDVSDFDGFDSDSQAPRQAGRDLATDSVSFRL
jgi:phage protein, HK97 gp10 family